ncbi:hypothetical protein DOD04_08260 [Klebsiella michiganensis]|nr:hypothetical protein [Klebsiella michiganensis]RXI19403.1 hypothetical protein DOD04_08260 [Klebsiella michiganensis]
MLFCWLLSFTPVTYLSKFLGINERLLPLTGGQPSGGQIRSRRICLSLAASKQLVIHWVQKPSVGSAREMRDFR